ncbi:protein YgfX [Alteromonas ponticola]|uniref:Toxin CptA n=1 Tax=Alteromonas ponticola TaxID=2720613 RepID=A0ABX1R1I9_9ALTE|nr:protein YgfX [Alteromonas ponticola]NMH58942.1 hypothetical protein [Alteromonas ponticola]
MLTASKYRVDISPSPWRNYQWLIPTFAAWAVLHSLSENTYSWVPVEYLSIIAGLLSIVFYWHQYQQPRMASQTYLLGEDGSWQQTMEAMVAVEGSREILSDKSRVTPLAVFLSFSTTAQSRWLLKGECDEQNYRRLCRIVLRHRNATQDKG